MIKKSAPLLLLLLVCTLAIGQNRPADPAIPPQQSLGKVTLTILFDNVAYDKNLKPGWGFACLIQGLEKTILFDTGAQADILSHNIKLTGVDTDRIQYLVISHTHGDHTGGLEAVAGGKSLQALFLPEELPSALLNRQNRPGLKREILTSSREICPDVHTTGVMGDQIIEQSLIIDMPQGLVLITGCAHPGIVSILQRTKKILNKEIYLVLGGFHLLQHTDEQVQDIIASFKSMGIRYCGATHCTGDKAITAFRKAYGDHFVELGAGRTIHLNKDSL
jgi:7,8-dihydropterin-6-yl-methyl-4-(beta-D-ribofuranosyl)aminobenzene 5'-phosphate synthase